MLKRAHPTCAHTHTHPFPSFLPRFTPTSIKALARGILPYQGAVAELLLLAITPWPVSGAVPGVWISPVTCSPLGRLLLLLGAL